MKQPEQWHLEERDFFHGMDKEKKFFLSIARRRAFQRNAMIFFEDDPSESCFYLEKGIIKIFKITSSGKEPIFFIRRSGSMFGLAEVVDSRPRKSNAQALSDCVIWDLKKKDFERMLESHLNFSRRIISCLGQRIRYLGDQMESLMVCDVVTRLAKLIVYLAYERIGKEEDWERPVAIQKILTQEQMASMAGSCQQTVSEVMKSFQDEGLVRIKKGEITVVNPLKLIRKAEIH